MTPADLGLPAKFTAFRTGQADLVHSLAERDYRFDLLSAPTGSGKSVIYVAAAILFDAGRTVIVTKTKMLQEQLERDFGEMGFEDIRGKDSYCAIGDVVQLKYWRKRNAAKRSSFVVTNYAYWLTRHPKDDVGTFDLLILDEAHQAPDGLLASRIKLFKPSSCRSRKHYEDESRYVIDATRDAKGRMRAIPIWTRDEVQEQAERYLFRDIDKVILVSGVLHRRVIDYLGLPENRTRFQEYASHFDPKRRPLIYLPTARVDHRINEGGMRQLVNRIDRIIEKHAIGLGQKGIIHAVSFVRAWEIANRSSNKSRLLTHESNNTKETVNKFKRAKPGTVLLSPSVEEGYDFPLDECRFQILVKVPFVYSKTPIIQARAKSDKRYLDYITAMRVVQQVGRGMRSVDDECTSYILDDHWFWFRHKSRDMFPEWFQKAWKDRVTV
jgi:Rad3-related DNA helicase